MNNLQNVNGGSGFKNVGIENTAAVNQKNPKNVANKSGKTPAAESGGRIALLVFSLVALVSLGLLFIYAARSAAKIRPQEVAGDLHNEEKDGPFILHALVGSRPENMRSLSEPPEDTVGDVSENKPEERNLERRKTSNLAASEANASHYHANIINNGNALGDTLGENAASIPFGANEKENQTQFRENRCATRENPDLNKENESEDILEKFEQREEVENRKKEKEEKEHFTDDTETGTSFPGVGFGEGLGDYDGDVRRERPSMGPPLYVVLLHGLKCSSLWWLPIINAWTTGGICNDKSGGGCGSSSSSSNSNGGNFRDTEPELTRADTRAVNETSSRATAADEPEREFGLPSTVFILPDLLGHGKSPWPRQTKISAKTHVNALMRLLERARIPPDARVCIGGVSLGSLLALELAAHMCTDARWRARLAGVALLATPFYSSRCEGEKCGRDHSFFFRHKTLHRILCNYLFCRQKRLWKSSARRLFSTAYPSVPAELADTIFDHSFDCVNSCVHDTVLDHSGGIESALRLRENSIPVLLVNGERDRLCPPPVRERLRSLLHPTALSITLSNVGHSFVAERPSELGLILQQFFTSIV